MAAANTTQRLHVLVRGRVQGVSFRWSTQQTASRLGLTGYVRNRLDGGVEVVAEGSRPLLETLLAFLEVGPPAAQVAGVAVEWQPATAEFATFEIR